MFLSPAQIGELAEVQRRGRGRVRAREVVDYARRNTTSALHTHSAWQGWDQSKAAEAHWRAVARSMIQVYVQSVPHPHSGEPIEIRALVSTPEIRERLGGDGYMGATAVAADPALRRSMLLAAIHAAEQIIRHYGSIPEVLGPSERFLADLEANLDRMDTAPPPAPRRTTGRRAAPRKVQRKRKQPARKQERG